MRVLFLSTSYPHDASDWRGVFMRSLVDALARARDVDLDVWAPPGDLPARARSVATQSDSAWLFRLMQDGGISHVVRERGIASVSRIGELLWRLRGAYKRNGNVDLYHVNWLQSALPLPFDRIPALISVLGNDLKLLKLPMMATLLRRVMRRREVAICPNAEWMQEPLQAAFGDVAHIIPVPFGIEAHWYDMLRRPTWQEPVWLVVTRLTRDKLGSLFDWSEMAFRGQRRELHLFGPMQERIDVPEWIRYHGVATPAQLAQEWFPRACGLISLSRHAEGRPQVMLEAMASGLPVIASRIPGHESIVKNAHTGVLCDSPESYAEALNNLEDAQANLRLGENARHWCRSAIGTWDDSAQRYARVYRQLLGQSDA